MSSPTPALAAKKIEIKYLAPDPTTLQQLKSAAPLAVTSTPDTMDIYFFDTLTLDLLTKQHIILRLRRKSTDGVWVLTVKERPSAEQPGDPSASGDFVMEKTVTKPDAALSYSLDSTPPDAAVTAAVQTNAVQGMLSSDQAAFLQKRLPGYPWEKVLCFPKISSTRWDLPQMEKLDAEDWTFPGGEVLELSLNAKNKDAAEKENELITFLSSINLSEGSKLDPSKSGGMKTSTVLNILKNKISQS